VNMVSVPSEAERIAFIDALVVDHEPVEHEAQPVHVISGESAMLSVDPHALHAQPHHPRPLAHPHAHEKKHPKAFINGGATVAFGPNVTDAEQESVNNALQLAQRAAIKAVGGDEHKGDRLERWYDKYCEVLGHVGFDTRKEARRKVEVKDVAFSVDAIAIELLASVLEQDAVAIAKTTLDALRKLKKDDEMIKVFDKHSKLTDYGSFQSSVVVKDESGAIIIGTAVVVVHVDDNVTNLLFFHFGSRTNKVHEAARRFVFNQSIYDQVAEAVKNKLGKDAKKFVMNIKI